MTHKALEILALQSSMQKKVQFSSGLSCINWKLAEGILAKGKSIIITLGCIRGKNGTISKKLQHRLYFGCLYFRSNCVKQDNPSWK